MPQIVCFTSMNTFYKSQLHKRTKTYSCIHIMYAISMLTDHNRFKTTNENNPLYKNKRSQCSIAAFNQVRVLFCFDAQAQN